MKKPVKAEPTPAAFDTALCVRYWKGGEHARAVRMLIDAGKSPDTLTHAMKDEPGGTEHVALIRDTYEQVKAR